MNRCTCCLKALASCPHTTESRSVVTGLMTSKTLQNVVPTHPQALFPTTLVYPSLPCSPFPLKLPFLGGHQLSGVSSASHERGPACPAPTPDAAVWPLRSDTHGIKQSRERLRGAAPGGKRAASEPVPRGLPVPLTPFLCRRPGTLCYWKGPHYLDSFWEVLTASSKEAQALEPYH